MDIKEFQELVWDRGRELYRDMPWRQDTEPYGVMVSEIMLQQTQVERVIPKHAAFMSAFPTIQSLANATLEEVLRLWSGLGYNRRAKFLHEAARKIVAEYNGVFPQTLDDLVSLPGIGVNTAGAVLAYSFNQPVVYVETNIRTVYFYHFFEQRESVTDSEIRDLVASTIDQEHPREWYWALMDYGSFLKRQGVGQNNKSRHYTKQTPLKGSVREVRGQILALLAEGAILEADMPEHLTIDNRFEPALAALEREGMVSRTAGQLHLPR